MLSSSSNRIKIIFALPSLLAGGGIENHAVQQIRFLSNITYDIHVITLFLYPNRPTLFDMLPPYVTVHQFSLKGTFDMKGFIAIYFLLKQIAPDLVVSSMFSANTIFRLLKPFVGYISIAREHNTYTDKKWYHHEIDFLLSYCSHSIIAVSEAVKEFVIAHAHISPKKIIVINNGVDTASIDTFKKSNSDKALLKQQLGLQTTKKYIINVARLKAQKNQALLISAFAKFVKKNSKYSLLIVGEGNERSNLEALIDQLDIKDSVFLLGYRKDIYSLYAVSDLFVLTSYIEGFPNVCIEAMAFGLPVISTRVAGVPEIIVEGENGWIVQATADSVTATIERYVQMSEVKKEHMSVAAHIVASGRSIEHVAHTYEVYFRKLLQYD